MTSHRESSGRCQQQTRLQLHLEVRREREEERRSVVSTTIPALHIILMIFSCCPGWFLGSACFGLIPFASVSCCLDQLVVRKNMVEDFYGSKFWVFAFGRRQSNIRIMASLNMKLQEEHSDRKSGIFTIAVLHACVCNYRIFIHIKLNITKYVN